MCPADLSSLTDLSRLTRCVVYTRTSSDEEATQEFGSIEAQRDAGLAYIASQRHAGWYVADRSYDDPGYSGGTMDRPGLWQLRSDIEAGLIRIVVVYKIDRLSRSLVDFTTLMAFFKQHDVALVAVTQHLNTLDATGNLAINMLMSFAQFERELSGDRIRDKIKATRRKGLWMISAPPLGYDVCDQHLTINDSEAKVAQSIFQHFVELGSVTALVEELRAQGVATKSWRTHSGKVRGGRPIDKSYLYRLLNNRMLIGEIFHDDAWHPGIHTPIIDRRLWEQAHALLSGRRRVSAQRLPPPVFMLTGLVVGNDGRAYSPWRSSIRNGRYYSYYVPQKKIALGAGATDLPRLSAADLEALVVGRVRTILREPGDLLKNLPADLALHNLDNHQAIETFLAGIDDVWEMLIPPLTNDLVRKLIVRVVIHPSRVEIEIRPGGIVGMVRAYLKEQ